MKSLIIFIFYLAVSNGAPRIGESANVSKTPPTVHPFVVISSNKDIEKDQRSTEKPIVENATTLSIDDAVTGLYISVNQSESIQDEDEDVVVQSLDDIDVIKSKPKIPETTTTTKRPNIPKTLADINRAVAKTVAHYSPSGLGPKAMINPPTNKPSPKIEADTSSIEEDQDEEEGEDEPGEEKPKSPAKFQPALPIKTTKVGAA